MSNYEEWTELFKSEVESHLELILQNDYDEHYYASYLKSLEDNQDEISDVHEEEIVIDNDDNHSSMQTEIIAIVLFSCALLWLLLQARKKWKKTSINLDETKELPVMYSNINRM